MKKSILAAGLISLSAGVNIQAADVQQGHELVETNCVRCHGSEIYTRPDRRVTSLPGLHKQVRFCEQMLGLTWFDEDVDNTATYLNQEYYKFE
ncbi:MAG: cytochrome c [Candidatus Thiodiazotropha sp. (ex Monitilora ramsayi)]|nr:cytochrome c [Candidatus Thiodiazotropha sp. (ex Monitilora ramsayi)]